MNQFANKGHPFRSMRVAPADGGVHTSQTYAGTDSNSDYVVFLQW